MANQITTLRLALLFVLVAIVYAAPAAWQVAPPLLLVIVFALDGLDGFVARNRHEVSRFGAMYDIAADRVVENVLWVVATHLSYTPVWVPIVFITRGFVVDLIRAQTPGTLHAPFGVFHSAAGRWITESRFVRILYAVVKAAAFGWILAIHAARELDPDWFKPWTPTVRVVTWALVGLAVGLCLIRAAPVILSALFAKSRRGDRAPETIESRLQEVSPGAND
jgi:CDP-diacylglycerol--glycerol-3-phosphate 3-phosphatidyltransferase